MDSTEHECTVELLNSRVSSFAESVVVSPINSEPQGESRAYPRYSEVYNE